MAITSPIILFTIDHFKNSRSVRNLVESIDLRISQKSLFMGAKSATRFYSDPIIYADIGARGGEQKSIVDFSRILHFVVCDADPNTESSLSSDFQDSRFSLIKFAISDSECDQPFYQAKGPANSSFLKPEGHSIALRGGDSRNLDRFEIENITNVKTTTLSHALPKNISNLDILKVDVQGLEFEVISGIGHLRPFLLCIECSTVELYLGQKTLFEVGSHLRNLGYMPLKLMEIQLVPKTKATKQSCIQVHGDVIFVPDNSKKGVAIIKRDIEKWFAALCMHGYMDFALWQLSELKLTKPPLVIETEEML